MNWVQANMSIDRTRRREYPILELTLTVLGHVASCSFEYKISETRRRMKYPMTLGMSHNKALSDGA